MECNDDETKQNELDREAFTETYGELKARIGRMISEDRTSKRRQLSRITEA